MTALPRAWPTGRSIAISVNVMLEQWADDAAPGLGPMGKPLKPGVIDTQARSWAAYGPRVGAWRILDLLAETKTEAVFYASGMLAERHADLIRAVRDAGHTVAAHGWTQDILPVYQAPADELRDLQRSAAAIARAAGDRPMGFLSPRCTPSAATASLLVDEGILWHADYFDADLPYELRPHGGSLVAIPFSIEVNDLPLSIRYGNEPDAFASALISVLEEGGRPGTRPACADMTVHAHIFGRPAGIGAFRRAIGAVRDHADTAFLTTHAHLARMFGPGALRE
jgi:peptidoglycan/xylan/chitin deacetylase (PgdA/CDA1 family)